MEASSEREKDREKRKRKQNDGEEQNVIKVLYISVLSAFSTITRPVAKRGSDEPPFKN